MRCVHQSCKGWWPVTNIGPMYRNNVLALGPMYWTNVLMHMGPKETKKQKTRNTKI